MTPIKAPRGSNRNRKNVDKNGSTAVAASSREPSQEQHIHNYIHTETFLNFSSLCTRLLFSSFSLICEKAFFLNSFTIPLPSSFRKTLICAFTILHHLQHIHYLLHLHLLPSFVVRSIIVRQICNYVQF